MSHALGRIRFIEGNFSNYGSFDKAYTKIFAINVLYFWDDLLPEFSKIFTLLKLGGSLILFISSPERLQARPITSDSAFNKHTINKVESDLLAVGFLHVAHETVLKGGFETYYVRAEK